MHLLLLSAYLVNFVVVSSASHCNKCEKIICPKNENFTITASSCQPTCFNRKPEYLFLGCTQGKRCVCKKGYIRHPTTYQCIPVKSCPVKKTKITCPVNEIYSESAAGCQRTCSTQHLAIRAKCNVQSGCICKKGFIRDDIMGQCVPLKSCEKCAKPYSYVKKDKRCIIKCNECQVSNEEYTLCGSRCGEPGCNKDLSAITCLAVCEPGCFCKSGYVRDELAQLFYNLSTPPCVMKEDCEICPDNEVAGYGSPLCERTCENKDEECTIRNIRAEFKCYCAEGYVRESEENPECIPVEDCPSSL